MKKILLLSLLVSSFSALATSLSITSSVTMPDYVGMTVPPTAEVTANISVYNPTSFPISFSMGSLSNNGFRISSNNCTCSLLDKRTCTVQVAYIGTRVAEDYVATDSLEIDGQIVPISVTVKAMVPVVNTSELKVFEYPSTSVLISSLDFGTITSATWKTISVQNLSATMPLKIILPSGMRVVPATESGSITNCGTTLNNGFSCRYTLELKPITCAGAVYSRDIRIVGSNYRYDFPVTADFTGAGSPLCIP